MFVRFIITLRQKDIMELSGKTALITGSAIRLGWAISLALAEKGCNLILHYHYSVDDVHELLEQVSKKNISATLIKADLTDENESFSLFTKILESVHHVDILVNNAGIYLDGNALQTTKDIWDKQFMLNLRTPFILSQEFARQLPEGLPGRILNISDAKVLRPKPDHFAYRLTKSSMNEMTKMLAKELAPNITVNAIAPGLILPLAGREAIPLQNSTVSRIPLQRLGGLETVAMNAIHILEQDFMTGQIIALDGGEFL
jgi:NAD(P)-dependent dehydrogenase (short-subunit alcohol dehydrogenase family)